MVARIATPNSIRRALNYNEQKVKNRQAELLAASGYLKDPGDLNFAEKLVGFTRLMELNNSKTNALHISLNFDISDALNREKLISIADEYMSKIGFGEQPYLVYQHHDAGHPHIHIVTTSIQPSGKRIDTYNIGRNQSEKARKEIEQDFGLVKAEGRGQFESNVLKPVNALKVSYGKQATKQAIANVLNQVLDTYKYTSLPELNAVLKQYNVTADRGSEQSRIYKNNGLVYRVFDDKGNKTGVPIKASDIFGKPTLARLESNFAKNEPLRQQYKARVKNAIDLSLLKNSSPTLSYLIGALDRQGIYTALRQNESGIIYGITYVDHQTKCVFNGSALGKPYSAGAILERCNQPNVFDSQKQGLKTENHLSPALGSLESNVPVQKNNGGISMPGNGALQPVLDKLFEPVDSSGYIDAELKNTKKKKRKNITSHL